MLKHKYIYLLAILFACLGLASCDTDYMAYDTGLKDGIYFPADSLNFQFGMNKGEEYHYEIPVTMVGTPKDYDRRFRVIMVDEETTAKKDLHYDMDTTFVIPANGISSSIKFTLYRYKDPEMTQQEFVIKMKLEENENFRLIMKDTCKLYFSDTELPRPRWWSDRHFGPYSQMLMIDIMNNYWDLEETFPQLYQRIENMYGRDWEYAYSFPYQYEVAIIKYVITPAYEYYQEHPNPRVDIPDPSTLL